MAPKNIILKFKALNTTSKDEYQSTRRKQKIDLLFGSGIKYKISKSINPKKLKIITHFSRFRIQRPRTHCLLRMWRRLVQAVQADLWNVHQQRQIPRRTHRNHRPKIKAPNHKCLKLCHFSPRKQGHSGTKKWPPICPVRILDLLRRHNDPSIHSFLYHGRSKIRRKGQNKNRMERECYAGQITHLHCH